ncbi:MAG: hypothetical protein ACPGFA_04070 [Pikeienuella sp.]
MKAAMIGVGLVLVALVSLYQMRNGALLYVYQQFFYAPPAAEGLADAFYELAETESATPGTSLGEVAAARLLCAEELLGARPPLKAEIAFHRLNLILLGAGLGVKSPVVDPVAHYVVEIRGDLGRDTAVYRTTPPSEKRLVTLTERLAQISAIDHRLYDDLLLTIEEHRSGVTVLTDALISGGLPYYECVAKRRL